MDCKDKGIRKSEFVAKTQNLWRINEGDRKDRKEGIRSNKKKIEEVKELIYNCPWKGWVACIVRSLAFLQWVNW